MIKNSSGVDGFSTVLQKVKDGSFTVSLKELVNELDKEIARIKSMSLHDFEKIDESVRSVFASLEGKKNAWSRPN